MKKHLLIITLLASLAAAPAAAQALADEREAPAFEITLLDSTRVDSRDLAGQVIFLAFTRTVLPSNPSVACARSVGLLTLVDKELIPRFREEEDLVILPVIMHYKSRQEITRFLDRYHFNFSPGVDERKKVYSRFAAGDAPRLFLIDREGKLSELPSTRDFTGEERTAYKARTGKTLPATKISLDPTISAIDSALAVLPRGGIEFLPLTLSGALARAREEGKPVLAVCHVPWYASSRHLLAKVFTRRTVGDYCNARFIPVQFNMEEKEGQKLQKRLDLPLSEPTTLLFNPDGTLLYRTTGDATATAWLEGIRTATSED
ncbi:MAG: thioredoxin family protein [Odoribacteraceae bacterium]|jgi:peroxiredoxin|nr:thioredoxin family protein [Odoribacteraceae bacterium]